MPQNACVNLKVRPFKALLNGNFSQAGHSEIQAVVGHLHQSPRPGGNMLNTPGRPNQQMRIQQ